MWNPECMEQSLNSQTCLLECEIRGQKRHINIWHINFFCRHSPPVCPRDNPGLSQGQTGLPLCKIRRKPRFVPSATGPKRLCLCAFFLAWEMTSFRKSFSWNFQLRDWGRNLFWKEFLSWLLCLTSLVFCRCRALLAPLVCPRDVFYPWPLGRLDYICNLKTNKSVSVNVIF